MTDETKPWRAEMPLKWDADDGVDALGHNAWVEVCNAEDVQALVTKCNAELDARDARIAELEARLQISPYGDDKIDELSDACEQLRARVVELERKVAKLGWGKHL